MAAGCSPHRKRFIGNSGTGIFTQSGGTNSASSYLYLGYYAGSSGTYSLSGGGLLSVGGNEFVGYSGTGSFAQSGGTNSAPGLWLGFNTGGSGTYNLSGSGLLSVPYQFIGNSGSGSFTQSAGTNAVSGRIGRLSRHQRQWDL